MPSVPRRLIDAMGTRAFGDWNYMERPFISLEALTDRTAQLPEGARLLQTGDLPRGALTLSYHAAPSKVIRKIERDYGNEGMFHTGTKDAANSVAMAHRNFSIRVPYVYEFYSQIPGNALFVPDMFSLGEVPFRKGLNTIINAGAITPQAYDDINYTLARAGGHPETEAYIKLRDALVDSGTNVLLYRNPYEGTKNSLSIAWLKPDGNNLKSTRNSGSFDSDSPFINLGIPLAVGATGAGLLTAPNTATAATVAGPYIQSAMEAARLKSQALEQPWVDPVNMIASAATGGGSMLARALRAGYDALTEYAVNSAME